MRKAVKNALAKKQTTSTLTASDEKTQLLLIMLKKCV